MKNQVIIYFILLLAFSFGGIYDFIIGKQCIYTAMLTKPRAILLIIISIILFSIAYIGGNLWYNYLLVISAIVFVISGVVGEGIHERGIYYRHLGGSLMRLAKWEYIENIKINTNKNKLESFN